MNLKKEAVSGVKWSTLSTVVLASVALLRLSILARFLDAADFGLMALVMFVLGFTNLFMDMGFTSAILHKQNISLKEYSSLYWMNVLFSLILFILLYLFSPLVASFYSESELLILIPLMAFSLIISSVGRQFKTILQKELKFKEISVIESVSAIISLVLAVYLAVEGYGVYSLVFSSLLQYTLSNILFFILGISRFGLLFHFKLKETYPFLKIGIYQVGSQVINYFNKDIDVLIIGKVFGAELLGGYNLAKQLVYRPIQVINPVITRVASPVLAKYQYNTTLLKKHYLTLVSMISTVNIPIYIGIVIFSPWIVEIMYGSDFLHIVYLTRLLSLYMLIRAISNPIGSLIIATGKTGLEFKWNLITLIITPLFVLTGTMHSLMLTTLMLTLSMLVLFVPSWWILVRKLIGASFKEYVTAIFTVYKFWVK